MEENEKIIREVGDLSKKIMLFIFFFYAILIKGVGQIIEPAVFS